MITVTCDKCKQEVTLPFYFYDIRIIVEEEPLYHTKGYVASAMGRATCPWCGAEVRKHFSCHISQEDIIKLATFREITHDS